jgi:hypothetical protein
MTPNTIICVRHDDGDPFVLRKVQVGSPTDDDDDEDATLINAFDLERILMERVIGKPIQVETQQTCNSHSYSDNVDNDYQSDDEDTLLQRKQLFYRPRRDVAFLKCTGMVPSYNLKTILALSEDNQSPNVKIDCYQSDCDDLPQLIQQQQRPQLLQRGPHSDWKRNEHGETTPNYDEKTPITSMSWMDLRQIQDNDPHHPLLSSEAGVVELLRSILTPSHDASPWVNNNNNNNNNNNENNLSDSDDDDSLLPDIVVLVLKDGSANENDDNDNDQKAAAAAKTTFSLLKDFRVSDVAPSWFLHCYTHLNDLESSSEDLFFSKDSTTINKDSNDTTSASPASLLIYKKLSNRQTYHITNPELVVPGHNNKSCARDDITTTIVSKGCLWEEYEEKKEENENNDTHHYQEKKDSVVDNNIRQYRLVSPPYLNLEEEYTNRVMSKLFSEDAIRIFTEDALSVPLWTPWPESAHYKTSSLGNEKPWTVFPLCHCFPANEPDNFTWVNATKVHVPRTCSLLEDALRCCDDGEGESSSGRSYLRTALFSQLAPGSVLEEHTGWADLANHVLRLHIPLIVPTNNSGSNDDLCGTWVDGCVETHAVGRPLLFDDSKIHRAFNYSDGNRIVLIVDIARPERLPLGTAESGHTDELDAFIEQMNIPN